MWSSTAGVRAAYGQTVAYSLDSVVSFLRGTHDDNLVVLVLGDHQPVSVVSGDHASHDVPVSIIARDPAVLDRISAWGWQDGLRPGATAPVVADGPLPRPFPHGLRTARTVKRRHGLNPPRPRRVFWGKESNTATPSGRRGATRTTGASS